MLSVVIIAAALAQTAPAVPQSPIGAEQVRQMIEKSLPFLEEKGLEWETTKCVSCHHGPWMTWTGYEAKKYGFTVNQESLEKVRLKALKAYNDHPKLKPTSRDNLTEMTMNVIYVTFGAGAKGEPDAETTKFMNRAAAHLIEHQKEDGSWKVLVKLTSKDGTTKTFLQPPLIDEDDATTLWSLLVLTYRKPDGVSEEALEKSKANGLRYLSGQPLGDTMQSLALRIMLYRQIGKSEAVPALVEELLSQQRDDGGWSQTKQLKSDALGTGQALVALAAAGVTSKNPAVVKAWDFLITNQRADGSWHVNSRAYQAPEFSSYLGTAWATLGLLRTRPDVEGAAERTALPSRQARFD
jgi:squalene-hopene/tetraprenyl-beta-curcumene cyclase